MGLHQKQYSSPFNAEPAPFYWVPAVSNFLLAAGSLLFLAYVAIQLRNMSLVVTDKAKNDKQIARIKKLEHQLTQSHQFRADLTVLSDQVARYFETQRIIDSTDKELKGVEKSTDRQLASLKKGVKGRKKKQVQSEITRVKSESKRQIALLKEKNKKAIFEHKKLEKLLSTRSKVSEDPALKGASRGK